MSKSYFSILFLILTYNALAQDKLEISSYTWRSSILEQEDEWYATEFARQIAHNVISHQSLEGGWPKNTDLSQPIDPFKDTTGLYKVANSFDNGATTVPMEFLAKIIENFPEETFKKSFYKGFDYILEAQYDNGGWPQFYPLRVGYYSHITYNDGAMVRILNLLHKVSKGKKEYAFISSEYRNKASEAIAKGIDCILKTQIKEDGVLKVWCAQHDEATLEPAWARAYEPPSFSGSESVGILKFLMSIDNPSTEIIESVESGVEWFQKVGMDSVKLNHRRNEDGRFERWLTTDANAPTLWARFYELKTERPLYLDRDSVFRYDFSEISYERRSGYSYHGYWPKELIEVDYLEWKRKHGLD